MSNEPTFGFLYGADMDPERILAAEATAQARFESIAAAPAEIVGQGEVLAGLKSAEIWGIVLSGISPEAEKGEVVTVRLRTGESRICQLLTTPTTVGTVADVLAEARYWELPLVYRDQLAALEDQK